PLPNDGQGELNNGYDLSSLQTTSMTTESPNIGSIDSPSTINPLSQSLTQDTASYRVDKKDFSLKDARALIQSMSKDKQLQEPSQYPWHMDGEWSDETLLTVIQSMHMWQKNAVIYDKRRQAQLSNRSKPGRTALPNVTKMTAAVNRMDRSELNSYMDKLWVWAKRQQASLTNFRCLSAQAKLSNLDKSQDSISDKILIPLLLASVPPYSYDPSRTIDMSRMPWHAAKGTFQWKPDDVTKVLSYVLKVRATVQHTSLKRARELLDELSKGPREEMLKEMDTVWKWWIDRRERDKRRARERAARKKAKASSFAKTE
ncbi:hypothetical protein H0H93_003928, partial [Arthromyces matolae]